MNPKYPVYIPTKGRWETPYTINALKKCGVPFYAVVEPSEAEKYVKVCGIDNVLAVPEENKGHVYARNWIWDHALKSGSKKFWTFDDNVTKFFRINNNTAYTITSGTFLRVIEDFVERYKNVPIAGMQYEMFMMYKKKYPPFELNRRIYSNMLIETDYRNPEGKPYRNEGFYNDDTDLCLRVLKDGNCTMQFNLFLINKLTTMKLKGGMTQHYTGDGRWKMAEELRRKHPDVTKITYKWGRWQHHVDYRPFRGNKLIKKKDLQIQENTNNYGMKLMDRKTS